MRAPRNSWRRSAVALASAVVLSVPVLSGCDKAASADQKLRETADAARTAKREVPTAPPTTQGSDPLSPQTLEAMAALARIDPADEQSRKEIQSSISEMNQADLGAVVAAYRQAEFADRQAAVNAMAQATSSTDASPVAKMDALLWLAQMETAAADTLMRDVNAAETVAARLTGEIRALVGQIQNNNALVAAYKKLEPAGARAYAEAQKQSAAGADASAAWTIGKDNVAAGPSQAALAAKVQQVGQQIQELQAKRDAAEKTRAETAAQAQQLEDQAKNAKGQQALDMLLKAAELRKTSRNALTEVEGLDGQIALASQELKLAETRQKESAKATEAVDAQTAQIEERWKITQARMQAYTDHSRRLLDASAAPASAAVPAAAVPPVPPAAPTAAPAAAVAPAAPEAPAAPAPPGAEVPAAPGVPAPGSAPGTPAPTAGATTRPVSADEIAAAVRRNDITAKASEIAALIAAADAKRQQALTLYESAYNHIEQAQGLAATVVGDLNKLASERGQGVEVPAWRSTMQSLASEDFNLKRARLQEKIARVHADRAVGMALRDRLRQTMASVVEAAGLTLPAPVAAFADAQAIAAARAAADKAFEAARALLEPVSQSPNSPLGKQAVFAEAMLAASRSGFYQRLGDAGAGDAQWRTAVGKMKDLTALDPSLGDARQPLPGYVSYLPADLAKEIGRQLPDVALPATAPSAAPATAPTAAPAGEVPTVPEVPPAPDAAAPGTLPADPSAPPAPPADPAAPAPAPAAPPVDPATPQP